MLEHIQRNHDTVPEHGLYLYEKFAGTPEFVSYREFPERIAAYADHFRAHGVGPGTRVIVPFETSSTVILSFFALMEVGAVPLSVKPLLPHSPKAGYEDFLGRVAGEFAAAAVLQTPSLGTVDLPLTRLPLPRPELRKPAARLRVPDAEEIAFVQFSSGSTSFPKGIPITQGRLRANLAMIVRTDGRGVEDRVSSWLPLYHDMGLVGGMLSCFAVGGDLLLAEPATFLFDAPGWWAHLARERIVGTVVPNFAVDYSLRLMRDLEADELAELDLSALHVIYLGSEPINIRNLEEFLALMAPAGLRDDVFMPCYGMAETVLVVTSRPRGGRVRIVRSPSGLPAISVGPPMPEFTVRLRTEDGSVCREGRLGEIELAGGTLADSYLDDARPLAGPDGFYATGDIGFVDGGELFITGRIGDRIKVNGQSLFAADFEQALEQLAFVRRVAVAQSGGRIVVLTEADRTARTDPDGCRARIAEHLVHATGVTVRPADVHFLRPGRLLRTSSGKLQRRAIVRAFENGDFSEAPPPREPLCDIPT
ncbi:AMP-binding protein [Catellatospora sp. NPDC049609]|uniref:AMP-binding protein n=1 Tax=Catellatospora sp. NPDC049609 TaxID=3155505 RepID=UPI00343806AF